MIRTLSGTNTYLVSRHLDQTIGKFRQTYGDHSITKFDAHDTSYTQLIDSVQTLPFLSERQLIIIKDVSANKELAMNIDLFLASVNDNTDVVLVESKFDKRSSLYKILKSKTEFQEQQELDERTAVRWLVDETQSKGGSISVADARYLLQRVGLNQQKLNNELLKLTSYAPEITKQTIDLLTLASPLSTIFDLLDASFSGRYDVAMQLYNEQRQLKVEPQAILALMLWQLHVLAVVKTARQKSPDTIAKEAKLNPYVVKKSIQLLRTITYAELKQLIKRALTIDIRLKNQKIDADEALKTFLCTLRIDQV